MSLQIEHVRPYQRNEPEKFQNFIMKYVYRQINSRCPQKF